MDKFEGLQKAFDKAIENGWRPIWASKDKPYTMLITEGVDYSSTIYSHDFAKALWGDGQAGLSEANGHWYTQITPDDERTYIEVLDLWEYRLQQMVIADDPIKYLGEHLDNKA